MKNFDTVRVQNFIDACLNGGMWAEWGDDGKGEDCLRFMGTKGSITLTEDIVCNNLAELENRVANMQLRYIANCRDIQIGRLVESAPQSEFAQTIASLLNQSQRV